jgi:hypothetical protein
MNDAALALSQCHAKTTGHGFVPSYDAGTSSRNWRVCVPVAKPLTSEVALVGPPVSVGHVPFEYVGSGGGVRGGAVVPVPLGGGTTPGGAGDVSPGELPPGGAGGAGAFVASTALATPALPQATSASASQTLDHPTPRIRMTLHSNAVDRLEKSDRSDHT